MPFGGTTYSEEHDKDRLKKQLHHVKSTMSDGKWRTLGCLEGILGYPQASISARLRDLRKSKFGHHLVERERVPGGNGLYRYRVILNKNPQMEMFFTGAE